MHTIYSSHASYDFCDCTRKYKNRVQNGKKGASKQRYFRVNSVIQDKIKTIVIFCRKRGGRIHDIAKVWGLSSATVYKWTNKIVNYDFKKINFKGKYKAKKDKWGMKQDMFKKMVNIRLLLQTLLLTTPMHEIDIQRLLDEH